MSTDVLTGEPGRDGRTLIDDLLDEQQLLTPVATFARRYEKGDSPAQAKYYQELIPLSLPAKGEQFAFAVNLDACTGCKACVTACHNLNGLDQEETWRDVGVLYGGSVEEPVQQTITTACHHCVDPACMNGCPVNAYDKDPVTGIVRHLDDQCIGCQYCILKCPYDVPKYSRKRGIVRKCDMCSARLAVGEAPACVQACPNEAISITIVDTVTLKKERKNPAFLPGAPDSAYTLPTTQYRTARLFPANMAPGDFHEVRAEHAHFPLVVMLVLTQLSVGGFLAGTMLRLLVPGDIVASVTPLHALLALALGFLAIGASTMHLGRPQYAWRAFVGLKTSWLSREIIVFGLFAGCAMVYAGAFWVPAMSRYLNLTIPPEATLQTVENALGICVAIIGLAGVFCSVMIYQDTRRTFWRPTMTTLKFFGTTIVLGPATLLFTLMVSALFGHGGESQSIFGPAVTTLCVMVATATSAKLAWEAMVFSHLRDAPWTSMRRTAVLMSGELKSATVGRFVCGVVGGVLLPVLGLLGLFNIATASATLILVTIGEFLERYLFFKAVIPPKMPGGIAS